MADARDGVDDSNQGWVYVDDLARMLKLDPPHLNIQIFRARKQLAQLLDGAAAPELVERRVGKLRLGAWSARIVRGSVLEGALSPFDEGFHAEAFPPLRSA